MTTAGTTGPTQAGDCADLSSIRAAAGDNGQLELQLHPEIEAVSMAGNDDQQVSVHWGPACTESDGVTIEAVADTSGTIEATSVGNRLRNERERRGWSRDDVAVRLKWQAGLVRRIEEDDYHGIEHAVYLRGYLRSYTRLLGLPGVIADSVVASHAQESPLVSTGTISRSRYLLDRYSVSATYLILTGLVIGPAVWLATHGGLEQNLARTVLLDTTSATTSSVTAPHTDGGSSGDMTRDVADVAAVSPPQPVTAIEEPSPIIASMAPFPALPQPAVSPVAAAAATFALTLKLKQASWVEVTAANGDKLEYSLLAAGTQRSYASDGAIAIRIGNAEGAEIVVDGKPIDLAPFRRANVAHLKVFGDGARAIRVDS